MLLADKISFIIGIAPFAILFADISGFVPEEYKQWLLVGIFVCAILFCLCLVKGVKNAMDMALLSALYCIIASVYYFLKVDIDSVEFVFDRFCMFICGIWIFAHKCKNDK